MWLSLVEHYVRDVGAAGSNPVIPTTFFGVWLSLVEYLNGVQGAAGSNPVTPTIEKAFLSNFMIRKERFFIAMMYRMICQEYARTPDSWIMLSFGVQYLIRYKTPSVGCRCFTTEGVVLRAF